MKYFKEEEFACKCGCGKGYADMDQRFLNMLDTARELSGVPYNLTSAFRCPAHNANVGGKPNSAHIRGHAADVSFKDSVQCFYIVRGLIEAGFKRIGINFALSFVHCDNDATLPQNVLFKY